VIYFGEIGVTVVDNFIAEPEVEEMLSYFDDMELSDVCTEEGGSALHDHRTGTRKWIDHDHTPMFKILCDRVSNFVGIDLVNAEKAQFLEYGPGEKYDPHFDAFDAESEQWQHYCKSGQRLVSVMGYLNDLDTGGGTAFPKLGLDIKPRAGRLLVWNNVGEDLGKPHPDSLHGGMPVEEGIKKCFTIWFREKPFNEQT